MLGPFILALDDYSRWQVGYPYCRVGFVYMLASGSRRPVSVNLEIGGIYVYFGIVRKLRHNVDRCEGCVPLAGCVKWRHPYEPVHALLGFQVSVRVVTLDSESDE